MSEIYTVSDHVQEVSQILDDGSTRYITVRALPRDKDFSLRSTAVPGEALKSTVSRHHSVYRAHMGSVDILSSTLKPLVEATAPAVNMSRVALGLCRNPPGWVRRISLWEGITALPPATTVYEDKQGSVQTASYLTEVLSLQNKNLSFSNISRHVLKTLETVLAKLSTGHKHVSADLSGGVDSTVISSLLFSHDIPLTAFHAGTDDQDNHDTQLARKIADYFKIDLVELESFTKSTAGFTLPDSLQEFSDIPRVWHANLPHLVKLVRVAQQRGSDIHFLGIGGDELFEPLPVQVLLYREQGDAMKAVKAVNAIAAAARWPKVSAMRAAFSRETKQRELQRRLMRQETQIPEWVDTFSWFPNFAIPAWLSQDAVERVIELIQKNPIPPAEDELNKYQFQIHESLEFQGEVLSSMNQYFGPDMEFVAPYLEDEMIQASLVYPSVISGQNMSKPIILEAMKGILPEFFYRDTYKSDYSYDLYEDYERSKKSFLKMIQGSLLAELKLVDLNIIREIADSPLRSTETLFDFERMIHMEVWLRENYV